MCASFRLIYFLFVTTQLTGDYEGLMKMLELGEQYPGAYPAWTGPADAQLISVHASTAKAILSGSGQCLRSSGVHSAIYMPFSLHFFADHCLTNLDISNVVNLPENALCAM